MSRLSRSIGLACAVAATLAVGGPAWAAAQPNPVADCNAHGTLTTHYTAAQLRNGLNTMPADIKEYTDCYDVLQRALLAELGSSQSAPAKSTSSGSGGSFLPTPMIVILVLLVLAAVTFGAVALRRRREAGGGSGGPRAGGASGGP